MDYNSLHNSVVAYLAYDDITATDPIIDDAIEMCESNVNAQLRIREMVASSTIDVTPWLTGRIPIPADYIEPVSLYRTGSPDVRMEYVPVDEFYTYTKTSNRYTIVGGNIETYLSDATFDDTSTTNILSNAGDLNVRILEADAGKFPSGSYISIPQTGTVPLEIAVGSEIPISGAGVLLIILTPLGVAVPSGTTVGKVNTIPSYKLNYIQNVPPLTVSNTTNWLTAKSPRTYLYGTLMELQPYLANPQAYGDYQQKFMGSISDLQNMDARGKWRPNVRMRHEGVTSDGAFRLF